MTIKFKEAISAQACVTKMDGRYFDGRRVSRATCSWSPAICRLRVHALISDIRRSVYR